MAKQNETTTKFKVDISELVTGMQQAKRQIALANAEFKAATAGMDNWSKSADGISAKLSQLDKTLTNQKSILASLESQYKLTAEQMGADSKEAENLRIKIENQKASIGKTEKEIRNYNKAIVDLAQEAEEAEKDLDNMANASDDLSDSVEDATKSAKDAEGGFTVLKGALANLVAQGVSKAVDAFKELAGAQSEASNIFQTSTGATTQAMEKYNDAIENIYKNNFGESLQDVAQKMAKVKEVTGELDASKLQQMTEAGITLEDTFGMDMTETLRGVQSLVNHFGISAEEAFDLMASGAQQGLNYTDELGDNVSEYAGKFAEAGYTTEEYFQLLKNGSQGGAYNLDKVNDSINEVTARLADGTIEDSIGIFSTDTQNLFKTWQNGGATQKQVIDSIVKDIQNTKGEQDKMNLAAKAFGTMAEDGGTQFIQSLSAVGDSFTDTKGKMEEIKEVRYDDVMNELSGLGRTVKLDLITPIVNELLPYIKSGVDWIVKNTPSITSQVGSVIDGVKKLVNTVKMLSPLIAGVGTALTGLALLGLIQNLSSVGLAIKGIVTATKLWTAGQWLLNAALSANPISLVVIGIAALVAAFVVLWNKSEAFRNFWIDLWENIKEVTSKVITAIGEFFSNLWSDIVELWGTLSGWFNDNVIQPLVEFFTNLFNTLSGIFSKLWSKIVEIFSPAVTWFSKLFTSIYKTLSSTITVIVGLVKGCWTIITTVFGIAANWFNSHVIQPISKFFTSMWNSIKSGASAAWNFIVSIFNSVSSWFSKNVISPVTSVFSSLWSSLKSGASSAWSGIKSVFSSVASFFEKTFSTAWKKVKDVFSTGGKIFDGIKEGIESAFKTIVNGLIKGINKVVNVPFKAINSMLNKIRNVGVAGLKPFEDLWEKDPISVPEIPLLYRGGVLKKGQTGYLEGNGDEAVVPLDKNTGWLDEVTKRIVDKGGISGTATQTVNNNYTYEYNQTNNSPKALSRLEIYRQTRNQFNYAVGGSV